MISPAQQENAASVLLTAGYEKSTPQQFLDLLSNYDVEVVVDVRKTPLRRKKGFSKNQLRDLLSRDGIDYVHIEALGAPKAIRDRLHNGGSWQEYVEAYDKTLKTKHRELFALINLSVSKRICLLCFERDPAICHRSLIASEITRLGNGRKMQIFHIRS